jgi:digeranylgeranylglycerophospholipid reductase
VTENECDVLVVGGGPAGLIAARELRRLDGSVRVLLVERDRAIGAPVRCGEGVGSRGLEEFISAEGADFVSRRITRVIFRSPNGAQVRVAEGDVGYVLDRTRFESALAAQAGASGASIRTSTEASGIEKVTGVTGAGHRWRVKLEGPRGAQQILTRVVVGADGVESMVGRWAGLDTRVPARDMESCAQYVVSGFDFDPDAIYLHFGENIAPGGYAWVFPKSTTTANVGLGIVALRSDGRSARAYLDDYIGANYPSATVTGCTVGGVIVHTTIKRTVDDGLVLCGDAAHMINPLSGGGIVNAMKAGRCAARVIVAAIADGDTSASRLQRFHDEWMKMLGDDHLRFYRVKEALNRLDDSFFDGLAATVNRIAPEKRTHGRIFASALVRHPSLMPVIAKYFV